MGQENLPASRTTRINGVSDKERSARYENEEENVSVQVVLRLWKQLRIYKNTTSVIYSRTHPPEEKREGGNVSFSPVFLRGMGTATRRLCNRELTVAKKNTLLCSLLTGARDTALEQIS